MCILLGPRRRVLKRPGTLRRQCKINRNTILGELIIIIMPVDAEWIEDCNVSINAEDDRDDHYRHLDRLQGRMVEVGIHSVVEVSDVVFIYFVQLDDKSRDNF